MVNNYLPKRDLIYLDGVSLNSLGYYAEMPQPVPPARQRYTIWQSGDTDHSSPDDSFEDVEYSITVRKLRSPNDFKATELYALAATAKTIIISRHAGRYFQIRRLLSISPVAQLRGNDLTYRITFALAPFSYHLNNPTHTMNAQNARLDNPGTRYSRPLYQCNHSTAADSILSVNGVNLTISKDAANPIYIDCERMIAYNSDHENQTQYTNGQFPFLQSGANLMSVISGSTIYEFYVTGNWRDY